jgi:hypothetical protein
MIVGTKEDFSLRPAIPALNFDLRLTCLPSREHLIMRHEIQQILWASAFSNQVMVLNVLQGKRYIRLRQINRLKMKV